MGKDDRARAERLAQALRDNLRRRKAQSRAQEESGTESAGGKGSGLDGGDADR